MRIQKFFGNNKDTGSFITVADIFGYVIAFFLLWLIILGYRTITKVGSHAPNINKIKSEIVEKSKPVVLEASKNTTEEIQVKTDELKETTKVVADSALEIISNTRKKAEKILSKEGAEETILGVNSYIDSIIHSVSDDDYIEKEEPNLKQSKKDSLSSF